jgi:hypothetical protein
VTSPNRSHLSPVFFCGFILSFLGLPDQGLALVELPSGRVSLDTTLTGTYDSYFIGTFDHAPDYYATLSPVLTYTHNVGPTNLKIFGGVAVNRYDKNSRFDSEDASAGISSNFPVAEGSRLAGDLGANYTESTQIDPIVNDRVALKATQFDLGASYRTGLKTTLSDKVSYSHNQRKIYGNQTIASNRLGFSYSDFLEDTNLNLSHIYTRTKTSASDYSSYVFDPQYQGNISSAALDQTANTFNVGVAHPIYGQIIGEAVYSYMVFHSAEETSGHTTNDTSQNISLNISGPFLPPARFPKVDSSASISYGQSASRGINDSGGKSITGSMHLAWDARERTRLAFGTSRSQSLGANNFSVITTQTNFSVVESIGLATTLSGTLNYTWLTFRGVNRSDNIFEASVNLQHSLTNHWSVGANYLFQNNSTNAPAASFQATRYRLENYTRQVVSLSVSCHY